MRGLLADTILVAHFALAAFIVLGLVLTWIGALVSWGWVRNFWFRLSHFAAIGIVAVEALLGVTCPLTVWEDSLRQVSGEPSFVARWVRRLLYYDLPGWAFTATYLAIALATAATWWWVSPHRRARRVGQEPAGAADTNKRDATTSD